MRATYLRTRWCVLFYLAVQIRTEIPDPAFSSGSVTQHLICLETLSVPVPSLHMQGESKTWHTYCLYMVGLVQPAL